MTVVTVKAFFNIATRLQAGQSGFDSLLHCIQIGSGAHPPSYPMGSGCSFPGGKVARVWSWPLTSI